MGVVNNASSRGGHITQKMRFEIEVRKVKWGLLIAFGDGKGRNKFLCFIKEGHIYFNVVCIWRGKGKKHMGMFCGKRLFLFIFVIRGIIISRRFRVYSLHRKNVFDFCCRKVWGVLKCKNLWVWSGKCGKLFWLQPLEGSIVGQEMVKVITSRLFFL
jgi:hypothetical protein